MHCGKLLNWRVIIEALSGAMTRRQRLETPNDCRHGCTVGFSGRRAAKSWHRFGHRPLELADP
jgi:hypothetical protein